MNLLFSCANLDSKNTKAYAETEPAAKTFTTITIQYNKLSGSHIEI